LEHTPPTLTGVCGSDPGISCRIVWDLSHNVRAAQLTGIYLSGPIHLILRLAFVAVLALLIRGILHRLINRVTERAAQALLPQFRSPLPGVRLVPAALVAVRSRRRRRAAPPRRGRLAPARRPSRRPWPSLSGRRPPGRRQLTRPPARR
jgi:small conductance mechanosensitive channel